MNSQELDFPTNFVFCYKVRKIRDLIYQLGMDLKPQIVYINFHGTSHVSNWAFHKSKKNEQIN